MIKNVEAIIESVLPDFTVYPTTHELRELAYKLGEAVESQLTYIRDVNVPVLFESYIRHNLTNGGEFVMYVSAHGKDLNMIKQNDPALYQFLAQMKAVYSESLRLSARGVI